MSGQAEPTSKPLRADARRNRDQVLAVAREILAAEGGSVSFDEIARRAGVGVGTVYRHFPTRTALFESIVVGRVQEFTERARTLAADDTAAGGAFDGYFAYLVGEIAHNQALCEALDHGTRSALAIPDQLYDEFNRSFEDVLAQAKKAGTVRADVDGTDVLDLLIGTARAVRRAQPRGSANQLITLVLDGLHTR
ncbi:TetR/AcrR family transcriptional regulator [Nocardia sp. NPDC059239]|uniref:TetR/AcrR family transcriptional regulator n=1 Tax=unclassified Nocardia TaxID=2637762 RepID=UPI0036A3BF1D